MRDTTVATIYGGATVLLGLCLVRAHALDPVNALAGLACLSVMSVCMGRLLCANPK